MTFEADLTRAFDSLTERLHAEIHQQVQAAMAELRAAAPVAPPPPEPPANVTPQGYAEIVTALRTMDAARSLTDILNVLASTAAVHGSGTVSVLLRQGTRVEPWRSPGVEWTPRDGSTRFPLTISGEAVGELYAEQGDADALEILARHASRCLESMTAFRTARALARQDLEQSREQQPQEDDASARRYAKLLVSEIKLYHEADVVTGRRERDLATRLGGEIARARVLYDQRVPAHVRQRADYFRDELVRTLADGDSTLLEFHA